MGYNKDKNEFWPAETETEFFLLGSAELDYIIERAIAKWPGIKMSDIEIDPQYIHLYYLKYDCYDSGDWGNFICIRKLGS